MEHSIKLFHCFLIQNSGYKGNWFIYTLNLDDLTERYCKSYFINDLDNGPDYNICTAGQPKRNHSANQIIDVATLKLTMDNEENDSRRQTITFPKDRLFPNNQMPKKLKNIDEFQRLWDKSTEESNPIIQVFKLKE